MTDAEVIKCLECRMPFDKVCIEAYDLINRQKAKIEELSEVLSDTIRIRYAEGKAEAIKEFAERLKKAKQYSLERHENIVPVAVVDWIVKEMVGDTE